MKRLLFIMIALLVGLFLFFKEEEIKSTKSSSGLKDRSQDEKKNVKQNKKQKRLNPINKNIKYAPISKEHTNSLIHLSKIMFSMTSTKVNIKNLIENLRLQKLAPYMSTDKNQYTGNMQIIRTKEALKGTRYFHAQFLSDQDKDMRLQHLSFEFRPGEKSFKTVIDLVSEQFSIDERTSSKSKDYISWNIDGHFVLWIKKLNYNDMRDDLYNAYDENDIGTIRVVLEEEIH